MPEWYQEQVGTIRNQERQPGRGHRREEAMRQPRRAVNNTTIRLWSWKVDFIFTAFMPSAIIDKNILKMFLFYFFVLSI